jgi:hypothetical protein
VGPLGYTAPLPIFSLFLFSSILFLVDPKKLNPFSPGGKMLWLCKGPIRASALYHHEDGKNKTKGHEKLDSACLRYRYHVLCTHSEGQVLIHFLFSFFLGLVYFYFISFFIFFPFTSHDGGRSLSRVAFPQFRCSRLTYNVRSTSMARLRTPPPAVFRSSSSSFCSFLFSPSPLNLQVLPQRFDWPLGVFPVVPFGDGDTNTLRMAAWMLNLHKTQMKI